WFITRNKIWESAILLVIAFSLFRPGFWMDMVVAPYANVPPAQIEQAAGEVPEGEDLRLTVAGLNDIGDPITFTALVPMAGASGAERLENAGMIVIDRDGKTIIDDVGFDSPAAAAGLDWDQEILEVLQPTAQPSKYLMFLPVLLVLAGLMAVQRMRAGLPAMPSFRPDAPATPAQ
ncbi:MAG: DUF3394 domain-containing protein, partial [Pseudomonadota bacterium]